MGKTFTPNERARITAESSVCDATIRKYPDVNEASRLRIERAARVLGIELPGPVRTGRVDMTGAQTGRVTLGDYHQAVTAKAVG